MQTVNPASLTPCWWIRMVEANWVLLLSDWSLPCFGSCRGWGSGQMALFLSASAPQGYKPLLFTMVATILPCSMKKQQLMRDKNHPGLSWGFIKRVRDFHSPSRGSMERARFLVPFLPLQIRNLPKTVELCFGTTTVHYIRAWIYSVFHSQHLLVAMMMLRSVVNMKKKESRVFP